MDKEKLLKGMISLLQAAVDEEGQYNEIGVNADSPLVGGQAIISSMGLVSYVMDVEAMVDEEFGEQVTLVNEQALSRRNSPFRTVASLGDYVMELTGSEPVAEDEKVSKIASG